MQTSRLRWLCRRGMKELDTAMLCYLQQHYQQAEPSEQRLFEQLLQEQDPEIFRWLNSSDTSGQYQPIIRKIRHSLVNPTADLG